jgi:hypothetical protein
MFLLKARQIMARHTGSLILVTMLGVVAFACSDGYGGSPSTPSTPALVSLQGVVTVIAPGNEGIAGATVTILDGANAGRAATTDGIGLYRFEGLTAGNANLSARAAGFLEARTGAFINGRDAVHFYLQLAPGR